MVRIHRSAFGKAFEISKSAAPETYKEFYGEWVKPPRTISENFIRSRPWNPIRKLLETPGQRRGVE